MPSGAVRHICEAQPWRTANGMGASEYAIWHRTSAERLSHYTAGQISGGRTSLGFVLLKLSTQFPPAVTPWVETCHTPQSALPVDRAGPR
jgi:hypothetical protein